MCRRTDGSPCALAGLLLGEGRRQTSGIEVLADCQRIVSHQVHPIAGPDKGFVTWMVERCFNFDVVEA